MDTLKVGKAKMPGFSWGLVLAVIAGVIGFSTSLWGVVAPPSTSESKEHFLFFGFIGVATLTASIVLNMRGQDDLIKQVFGIRADIQKLAISSQLNPDITSGQILAAAATKIIEQDRKILELQPRRLSQEQITQMTMVANQIRSHIKNIPVTAANGNQEAQAYAYDFVKVFRNAGCTSDLLLPTPGLTPDVQGIRLGVRNLREIPSEVRFIAQVLSAGGVTHDISLLAQEFFAGEPFVVIVGAK